MNRITRPTRYAAGFAAWLLCLVLIAVNGRAFLWVTVIVAGAGLAWSWRTIATDMRGDDARR